MAFKALTVAALVAVALPSIAAAEGLAGNYKGKAKGGDASFLLSGSAPDYDVEGAIAGPGCEGQFSGIASVAKPGVLVLKIPDEETGQACTITLTQSGAGLAIAEQGCAKFRSASCAYTGTLAKVP